jgi:hypothetical protein
MVEVTAEVVLSESIKGSKIASVQFAEKPDEKQYYDENLKKLISADEKQQKEAEKFFLNCTSDAVAYLETKKESIKEENTRWKIEALLSRLK